MLVRGEFMKLDINKVKIVVTIPKDNLEQVREAVCDAGAGVIGNYTYCSNSTKVIGTYIPNGSASPYIGKSNELQYVEEEKLEVVCQVEIVSEVIKRLRMAHPYEEPEIDIIPLIDELAFNQQS